MRTFLIAIFALLIFTTAQVAEAYERCDDAHCASMAGNTHDKQDKADQCMHHCCGTHVVQIAPATTVAQPSTMSAEVNWQVASSFTSHLPDTLLEPPSSL